MPAASSHWSRSSRRYRRRYGSWDTGERSRVRRSDDSCARLIIERGPARTVGRTGHRIDANRSKSSYSAPSMETSNAILVGVPRERAAGETRVALTPDAVQRLAKAGIQTLIEHDAGAVSGFADAQYQAAGAEIAADATALYDRATVIARVAAPSPEDAALLRTGTVGARAARAVRPRRPRRAARGRGRHGLRARAHAAHHARAVDGRAQLAGHRGRLPGRAARLRAAAALLPAADDRGRHRAARQGARARRRRRRPAGDRHRAPARLGRLGLRRARGRPRAGREPRRDASSRSSSPRATARARAATPRSSPRRPTASSRSSSRSTRPSPTS